MKKISSNTLIWLFVAILTVFYILSFTKLSPSSNKLTDNRKAIKTALANQKNTNSINYIELLSGNPENENGVILNLQDSFWTVSSISNPEISLPVESKSIENLIVELTKVRNLYKLSDKISQKNSYGLDDGSETYLNYYYGDNKSEQLIFGNFDFSKSYRYFKTDKQPTVYEIEADFNKFLSTEVHNWSDPYLISKELTGNKTGDIQRIIFDYFENDISNRKVIDSSYSNWSFISSKLLELRHSNFSTYKLPDENKDSNISFKLKLEFGDTSEITLKFFNTPDESEYLCLIHYELKYLQSPIDFQVKISSWTYNKIKEIML